METKNVKDLFQHVIHDIKEKKEARMAFYYSLFYFVFITLLLVFAHKSPAQSAVEIQKEMRTPEWTLERSSGIMPHAVSDNTIEIMN